MVSCGTVRLGSAWCGSVSLRFGMARLGLWCVVCGVWCVVCGLWCVGVWCVGCGVLLGACGSWLVALACGVRVDRRLAASEEPVNVTKQQMTVVFGLEFVVLTVVFRLRK